MVQRVGAFLDYENVHRTGHQLYAGIGTPRYETVVDPIKIAERLVAKRRFPSELAYVHVFRGRPVPEFQPLPASANDVQAAAWEEDQRATIHRRDLKYDFDGDGRWYAAREKGIDVALSVDLVETSMLKEFDAAIVFTCDTDVLPAIELVYRRTEPSTELACWSGAKPLWFPEGLRMNPPRRFPFCHFLNDQDFVECRDYSAVDR